MERIRVPWNEFISATFSAQLIYDDNTKLTFYKDDGVTVDRYGPGVQFRQVLGVGLSYKPISYSLKSAVKPVPWFSQLSERAEIDTDSV